MVVLKKCKTKECENKLQQLQWKERRKEEDNAKDGETRLDRIEMCTIMGIKKKKTGSGHRPSGIEENCIESE
jgi:hypothetical protein